MRFKTLTLVFSLIISSSAMADIVISSPLALNDACANAAGTWTGRGLVKASFVRCHYHGTAIVKPSAANRFVMNVDMYKDDGICPARETIALEGACENGQFQFKSETATIDGTLNDQANEANLTGEVLIEFSGSKIKAHIEDLKMHKQS